MRGWFLCGIACVAVTCVSGCPLPLSPSITPLRPSSLLATDDSIRYSGPLRGDQPVQEALVLRPRRWHPRRLSADSRRGSWAPNFVSATRRARARVRVCVCKKGEGGGDEIIRADGLINIALHFFGRFALLLLD